MPTISSGGMMPPPLERRISESTPGAILQPQPPPCEKLVRRGAGASSGTPEVESFMRIRSERWAKRILSARAVPGRYEFGHQGTDRAPLGARQEQRLACGALRAQAIGERCVGQEAACQRRQRSRVADREVAVVVGAE